MAPHYYISSSVRNTLIAFALSLAAIGCGNLAGVGSQCRAASDCGDGFQCFQNTCQLACTDHQSCGDGFRCEDSSCALAIRQLGDSCTGEFQCATGLTCSRVENETLCVKANWQVMPNGSECSVDADCNQGICAMGTCSLLCETKMDCAQVNQCTAWEGVSTCVPVNGTRVQKLPLSENNEFSVSVPDQSTGMVLAAQNNSNIVEIPQFAHPDALKGASGIISVLKPNMGTYSGRVSQRSKVSAVFKFGTSATVDVQLSVADLEAHPCIPGQIDTLHPLRNQTLATYWLALKSIMSNAGVELNLVKSTELLSRDHLASVGHTRLEALFSNANADKGLFPIVLVRSLLPSGVQAMTMRYPGLPPTLDKSTGVAVSMDTLCYRNPHRLARATAHQIARYMGVPHNVNPEGIEDNIADTTDSVTNLLHFGENGGTNVSPTQIEMLTSFPGASK